MTIENERDLEGLQAIGGIVARVLAEMQSAAAVGMTTADLDAIGAAALRRHGARSAPRLDYDFPGDTCISVNEEVAHGIPGPRRLAAGDMVNVDVSAELDGYYGDTGGSFTIGAASPAQQRLLDATRQALDQAMRHARTGEPLRLIGKAIEDTARRSGHAVIRNLCSHGVGRSLHEEPRYIFPYPHPSDRRRLAEGMVITIEPFLSNGITEVREGGDGWTLRGPKHCLAAQFEHTMVITRNGPIITTRVA